MSKKTKKPSGAATQRFLDIAEIRDDLVIMKDGTMRAVLMVSSINFALKTEDEQNAIVQAYVAMVNTLDHPLQIVIHSRKLDIEPYVAQLDEAAKKQTNELLRVQVADYRAYIMELVKLGDIMTKRFYAVVPYDPVTSKRKGWFARFKEVFVPAGAVRVKQERFNNMKRELDMRVGQISGHLSGMGLEVVQLDTQGLIELYYSVYNPDVFMTEKMGTVGELRVEE